MGESKVGVYLRVSTLDQEKGIASQEHALQSYLDGHGITDALWYRDRISGAKDDRPGFNKLKEDIFNGQVKTVVCWKLDRLSRSMQDGVNILCDWLKQGIRVIAVSQQLDFSGTVGQMIAGVLFAVAQMERENLRENTKRGLLAAKARGVKLGKRPKVFKENIQPLLDRGFSVSDVARLTGKSRQAIYNTVKREGITLPKQLRTCQQN
jgi:DNA invertase Pin-like site-specific DNA recombinase